MKLNKKAPPSKTLVATRQGTAFGKDGTQLRWSLYGKPGPKTYPTLVCCNGIGCSTFFWTYITRYFAEETQVLLWDYRGHGESGPAVDPARVTMGDNADDLESVMADAGITDALLVGHSMGCQVILESYRRHPKRIRGLVPMFGTYGRATYTFFNTDVVGKNFDQLERTVVRFRKPIQLLLKLSAKNPITLPIAARMGMVNHTMIKYPDLKPYVEHMAKVEVGFFMSMARQLGVHDAGDLLAHIKVPVLIIGGEKDIFTPVWLSEEMNDRIPNSEMMILPGGSHAALVEQPEVINLRIEKFVRERVGAHKRSSQSQTAQVLEDTSDERANMK